MRPDKRAGKNMHRPATSPAYYTALLSAQFSLSKEHMLSFVISEKHIPTSHWIISHCVTSSPSSFCCFLIIRQGKERGRKCRFIKSFLFQ